MEDRVVLSAGPLSDSLYVADTATDTVERFDATTGESLETFVKGNKSLQGPRGMVFDGDGHLLLANQNQGRGKPGEIMRYDAGTGAFQGELVPFQNPDSPFAPRGIVVKDGILYVASLQEAKTTKAGIAPDGRVATYHASTGEFLGDLDPPPNVPGQFNPRGVVFGPDGKLYVSVLDSSNLAAGHILQFDLETGTSQLFATNDGDGVAEEGEVSDLHRPEGLTFGPNGQLYVTSFRVDATDTDKVLVLNGTTGQLEDAINLDEVGQPRAFAQTILFGPGNDLYVPIAGNGPDTGAVRQYDLSDKQFSYFVQPGTLRAPWYLTFGNTDPATSAYVTPLAEPDLTAIAANLAAQPAATSEGQTEKAVLPAASAESVLQLDTKWATDDYLLTPSTPLDRAVDEALAGPALMVVLDDELLELVSASW